MYGVHPAHRFYRIYGKHLSKKIGNADITFSQVCLHALVGATVRVYSKEKRQKDSNNNNNSRSGKNKVMTRRNTRIAEALHFDGDEDHLCGTAFTLHLFDLSHSP